MRKEINYKNYRWLDISEIKEEDLFFLKENFLLPQLILEELKQPSLRSHVEYLDDTLFFVSHMPRFEAKIQSSVPCEIDFLVSQKDLITVTYQKNQILEEFFSLLESNPAANHLYFSKGPGVLLYHILKKCLIFSHRQLGHIQEKIQKILSFFLKCLRKIQQKKAYNLCMCRD